MHTHVHRHVHVKAEGAMVVPEYYWRAAPATALRQPMGQHVAVGFGPYHICAHMYRQEHGQRYGTGGGLDGGMGQEGD